MRELQRFRAEFNECHSLRSKMIFTNTICTEVSKMSKVNQKVIDADEQAMSMFSTKKNKLHFRRTGTLAKI